MTPVPADGFNTTNKEIKTSKVVPVLSAALHSEYVQGVNKMKYMRTYKTASAEESHCKFS